MPLSGLLKFLHRHIFLLPLSRTATATSRASGGTGDSEAAAEEATAHDNVCRELLQTRVALSLALGVMRPSNDASAAAGAVPGACFTMRLLIQHAPLLFP